MLGSATAETSFSVRFPQPVSACQAGLDSPVEQPDPLSGHTYSVKPRVLAARSRVVPPTETTSREAAGYSVP